MNIALGEHKTRVLNSHKSHEDLINYFDYNEIFTFLPKQFCEFFCGEQSC